MKLPPLLQSEIEKCAGISISTVEHAAGGSINSSCVLTSSTGIKLFLKFNCGAAADFFKGEAFNLREIARVDGVRPLPIAAESCNLGRREDDTPFLLLEYIESGPHDSAAEEELAGQLAALHSSSAAHWGFAIDNSIGSLPQPNSTAREWSSWGEFFFEQRLLFQADLGVRSGWAGKQLLSVLDRRRAEWIGLLDQGAQGPVLIHGDLWGGNVVWGRDGPVLVDPACYWGSGEADLAMSELFGGFSPDFLRAYWGKATGAKQTGYDKRKRILNLYHLLTHANMFGGGYIGQVMQTVS